jgi:hypothetical protein
MSRLGQQRKATAVSDTTGQAVKLGLKFDTPDENWPFFCHPISILILKIASIQLCKLT